MRLFKLTFILGLFCLCGQLYAASAPAIDLPSTRGRVSLEKLRGKVVYLDFWASWCQPCKKSFPWMQQMKQKYGEQGFEILAVNLDKDRQLADDFLQAMAVNFIVAFDAEGNTANLYHLKGMPSSYLIGRNGTLYASHIGFREKDKAALEQLIQQQLTQQ